MIAAGSPPEALVTYQIHMPLPSNAVPLLVTAGVCGTAAGRRTVSGRRMRLERRPARSRTYRTPETARPGTTTEPFERVVTRTVALSRRVAVAFLAKTATSGRLKLRPRSRSSPPGCTVRLSMQDRRQASEDRCGFGRRAASAGTAGGRHRRGKGGGAAGGAGGS